MNKQQAKNKIDIRVWVIALFVGIMTFTVYLPALQNDFVNWDDNGYVYENHNIQSIDLKFLKWVFTAKVNFNWHPLTLLSHTLDYAVWKLDPWGHHFTSILLHSFNTLLVFILVIRLIEYSKFADKEDPADYQTSDNQRQRLNKTPLIAGITTSILFGIHPLHVESVAWVSERKDVLYAFFSLLSLLAYLRYTSSIHSKKGLSYGVCLILFIMALLSKPMAVTLPVVLILLDFYPLGRLPLKAAHKLPLQDRLKSIKGVLIEKAPFFLLSLLSSLITVWAQSAGGALKLLKTYPLIDRICVAIHTFIFYLFKMILPVNLAPYYPYPQEIDFFSFEYMGSFILLLIITIFCIAPIFPFSFKKKGGKLFPVVWLYYLVTLIPVIGIIQVGTQAAADRYTYLPSLGPFLLAGIGIGYIFEKYSKKKYMLTIIAFMIFISCILANKTVRQIDIWKDSLTLWSYEINLFPDTELAYYMRGTTYSSLGKHRIAIADYSKAIELNSGYASIYSNRGNAYNKLYLFKQALDDLNMAIELNPGMASAYNNRGNTYYSSGKYRQAIADYNKAVELKPEYATAYFNLSLAYSQLGDIEQTLINAKKAAGLRSKQ